METRTAFACSVKNPEQGEANIEISDRMLLEEQVSIAMKEYERAGFVHQGPLANLLGVAAELVFDAWLAKLGLESPKDYEWNKRQPEYWLRGDTRPWDFRLKDKTKIEIGSARPYHKYAVFPAGSRHKKQSDIFIQIQIKSFNAAMKVWWKEKEQLVRFDAGRKSDDPTAITDPKEIDSYENIKEAVIGYAKIQGWDYVKTITAYENGWIYSPGGSVLTPNYPGIVKRLDKLTRPKELMVLIKSKLTKQLFDFE